MIQAEGQLKLPQFTQTMFPALPDFLQPKLEVLLYSIVGLTLVFRILAYL
jgi:hypothetical protein